MALFFVIPSEPERQRRRRGINAKRFCLDAAMKNYWVYIMSGRTRALYVGVTNDIERRTYEHRNTCVPGFTSKYHLDRLVYFEEHADVRDAIQREKQIKSWRREKKAALIESLNPKWRDLSLDWHLDDHSQHSEESLRVDPSTPPQKCGSGRDDKKRPQIINGQAIRLFL
jgi:putative endonuclease